jgi:hypothetical protein
MTEQPDTPVTPNEPTSDQSPARSASESTDSKTAETTALTPAFGWTAYAEQINGRFAMIGFVALLILELLTRQDFFSWLGLR